MSVTHRSLSVAVESSFGSLSSTTGLPDNSGLSFTSIPCERDPIIVYGDPVVSERNDARDGTFGYAPEPDTVWSGGSRVRRRTGQVTLRLDLTTVGSSLTNYEANYLGKLLAGGSSLLTALQEQTQSPPSLTSTPSRPPQAQTTSQVA